MYLVSKSSYTSDCIEICGVTGKKQTLPVAILNIRSPRFSYDGDTRMIVGCLHPWPFEFDVLDGNAFFESN